MTNEHKLEPVAWLLYHPANRLSMAVVERTEDYRLSDGSVVYTSSPLVLKSAAEAYAEARVREALEEAAKVCESRVGTGDPGIDTTDADIEAKECAMAIRALIPSQTGETG